MHNLYNNQDPFTVNRNLYKFTEFVKAYGLGLLIGVVVVSSKAADNDFSKYDMELQNNKVVITQKPLLSNEKEQMKILDIKQLDALFGYKEIAIDKIHMAIEENEYIKSTLENINTKYIHGDIEDSNICVV